MEMSSLYDAFFSPIDFQNGVLVFDSYLDDRATLAGCLSWVNRATVNPFGFGAGDASYAASARATALPFISDDGRYLMHLGAGWQHLGLPQGQFAVASRPLLRAGAGNGQTPNLVATGTFDAHHGADIVDLEWATIAGPLAVSAEYAVSRIGDVSDASGLSRGDAVYQAAYVEAGLFVTPGDHRRYDRKHGLWDRTEPAQNAFLTRGPNRGWIFGHGAVQLLARFTYLDLVSGNPVLTPTSGGARAGRQQDVTLGLTWYITSQTWFSINYVVTHIDSVVAGASGDLQGAGCRFHLDF
jgi:phosphate-selective porin